VAISAAKFQIPKSKGQNGLVLAFNLPAKARQAGHLHFQLSFGFVQFLRFES